jgi:hypothetical protein
LTEAEKTGVSMYQAGRNNRTGGNLKRFFGGLKGLKQASGFTGAFKGFFQKNFLDLTASKEYNIV